MDHTKPSITHPVIIFLLFLTASLLTSCSLHQGQKAQLTRSCIATQWPHEVSDLEPDPAVIYGRLDNGLRYVILKNQEPRNRVAMYLDVQAGSLQETEAQRGLAHYLEHMLFNGTTHYPPGTLVEYFQSIGMGFGADTNAHTGFDETVYKLLLPSGEKEVVADGMQVLADYARGALLLEDEVDRERGIILAEKRARDSVAARVRKKQLQFEFANTRIAERDPIGIEKVLFAADSDALRSYYDAWYRLENMVVVVVGDLDPQTVREQVEISFNELKDSALLPLCPEMGRVEEKGVDVLYIPEPELGYTRISYGTVFNEVQPPATRSWERRQLTSYVAVSILNNRLEKLSRDPESPFTSANTYAGNFMNAFGYATVTAAVEKSDQWQLGLATLQAVVDQALAEGFAPTEFERVKKELTAYLLKQQQTAATRSSKDIAGEIIRKLNSNEVYLSPDQEAALYLPMLYEMTLEDVEQVFARLWSHERRLLQVVGMAELDEPVGQTPEQIILDTVAGGNAPHVNLPAWDQGKEQTFPYLQLPAEPGIVISKEYYPEIDATSVLFEGGVRVNVKQTPFQENQVQVAVHFGQGTLAEPAPGMAKVAGSVIQESGTGKRTRQQLDELLAGTNIGVRFAVGADSFTFAGSGLTAEFEQLVQLLYTLLHDPGFRESALKKSRERMRQMYEQLESSVEGQQQLISGRFFSNDAPFYTMPTREQVMNVTLDQLQDWLEPVFSGAALEITVVGDIPVEQAIRLVGRYFGSEEREEFKPVVPAPVVFPAGECNTHPVLSSVDKALVTVAWQTDDFSDISRTRRLNVLASVLDDRLRITVREELGATYSPVVYNLSSRTHKGFGMLQSMLTVAPEQAAPLAELVKEVAAELADRGVSKEELSRSLEPTLTSIRDAKRSNSYWLHSVLALSSRHPEQLKWPITILSDFQSITPEDMQLLGKRYLKRQLAAELIVTSDGKPE
ncbi:MAG: hypothetical protein CSB34_05735 [Desulfobulbus propionicus]|nr:MAG: hypothetical protein CSB34_05735 [Desulfobulbus propionicus]